MVVDSNILIRHLVNDEPDQANKARKFLNSGTRFTIADVTVAEVYWVLRRVYRNDKHVVITMLEAIIGKPEVFCNRKLLKMTFSYLKEHNVSFIDAYTAAFANVHDDSVVVSFDHDFDKIDGITRQEP